MLEPLDLMARLAALVPPPRMHLTRHHGVAPPRSRAGDSMVLRAEMDLVVALSSCPASTCNGGALPKPLAFEIIEH